MSNFNWNSLDESTFQGYLNKYTNAFKRYQTRYFILDSQGKALLYFMPDEVRKKGPRGMLELTDCCVLPSDEDDVTFTIQTNSPEVFKLRAAHAKERQKWIDKLRAFSGTNAVNAYASAMPMSKTHHSNLLPPASPPKETQTPVKCRRTQKASPRQQTLKELNEVIRCVEISQREFVDTIEMIPENIPLNSLSKEMLLLSAISRSCISSLEDSLFILTTGRPSTDHSPHHSSSIGTSSQLPPTTQGKTSRSMSNGTQEKNSPDLTSAPSSAGQNKVSH